MKNNCGYDENKEPGNESSLFRVPAGALPGIDLDWGLYAQETPTLMTGKPVTGYAVARGGDLYQFIGLAGTDVQLSATLPEGGLITLYSPDGDKMTAVAGKPLIELKARLTDNAMYFVGVRAAQPGAA